MSELLPVSQAESLRKNLLEYLTTTFALADNDMQAALGEFLQSPSTACFAARTCACDCRSAPRRTAGGTRSTGTEDSRPTGIRRRPSLG
ncbi:hypothetical protein NKG05_10935 [Oerskovia sp. M15]